MKKIAYLLLVIGLLVVTTMPALAADSPDSVFALVGTITDISAPVVTVQVVFGNRLVDDYIGQMLSLQTTPDTLYLLKTPLGGVPITFDDLEVGQNVSVNGTLVNNVWIAGRITVGAALIHQP